MDLPAPDIGVIAHVAHLVRRCTPGREVATTHPQHAVALHRASGAYGIGDEWHRLPRTSLILLPAGDRDENQISGRDEVWWCLFDGGAVSSRTRGACLDLGGENVVRPRLRPLDPGEERSAITAFGELHAAWSQGTASARLRCRARLLDLLAMWAAPAGDPDDDKVGRFRRLIEARACDPRASLTSLARSAGGTADHLAAGFRRRFGCTPMDFRTRLRLQRARELLVHDPQPLEQIAHRCGLGDAGYLCRLFRRRVGLSPTAYARRYAGSG